VVAFLYRMDTGYPGDVNRKHDATVQAESINTTTPPAGYGIMVVMDAPTGTIRPPVTADLAPSFSGMYVRPYPRQSNLSMNDPLGQATTPTSGNGDVLKRGYMLCRLNAASPAVVKGQAVGVWTGAVTTGNPAGGVTGAAPAAGSVVAINATFMGPADANGMTEIAYNL
jgi:hypothetical protein